MVWAAVVFSAPTTGGYPEVQIEAPSTAHVGDSVSFAVSASDRNGDLDWISLDDGNGWYVYAFPATNGPVLNAKRVFTAPGVYYLVASASDRALHSRRTRRVITIIP